MSSPVIAEMTPPAERAVAGMRARLAQLRDTPEEDRDMEHIPP
jgi:hypothetical protein